MTGEVHTLWTQIGNEEQRKVVLKQADKLNSEGYGIVDSWVYNILDRVDVLIVTYRLDAATLDGLTVSHEHKELKIFDVG